MTVSKFSVYKAISITAVMAFASLQITACNHSGPSERDITKAAQSNALIAYNAYWGRDEWWKFVNALSDKDLASLAIAYGVIAPKTPGVSEKGEVLDGTMAINCHSGRLNVIFIMQQNAMNAFWRKTEKAATVFTNPGYHVEWHELVKRACYWADVNGNDYNDENSFVAEQNLLKKIVAGRWDAMNEQQRRQALNGISSDLSDEQKSALIIGSGTAMVAAVSGTALIGGFGFYTAMSSVLCVSSGVFGLTLPFAAYAGASSTVGVLTGPIGWGIVAVGAGTAAFFYFNDGDKDAVDKMVIATHLMKVKVALEK